jgi:hypothetical protein
MTGHLFMGGWVYRELGWLWAFVRGLMRQIGRPSRAEILVEAVPGLRSAYASLTLGYFRASPTGSKNKDKDG